MSLGIDSKIKFDDSIDSHDELLNLAWSVAGHTIDANVDMAGYDLDDVGNIALDTISSANGATIDIILGTASGDDFSVNNGSDIFQLKGNTGKAIFQNTVDSITGFQVLDADGGTPILNVDTFNERVGFGTATPGCRVDVVSTNPQIIARGTSFVSQIAVGGQPGQTAVMQAYRTIGNIYDPSPNNYERVSFGFNQFTSTGANAFFGSESGGTGVTRAVIFMVDNIEMLRLATNYNIGVYTPTPLASLHVTARNSTEEALILQGVASQSADYLQVLDSGSAELFVIESSGRVNVFDKIAFTQTDGNEYIDSLTDGELDLEATTSVNVRINGTEQVQVFDGKVAPTTDNDIDLGDSTHYYKNLYVNSIKGIPSFRSYFATTQGLGANPDVYVAGFCEYSAADSNLTQASTTQTFGTANISKAAHAFIVAGGAGVTDGSDLVLTVSGTSITDAGVRTPADSEVIVADCTAASQDDYYETSKKWLGQVTYTLSSTGGTAFSFDFNYGFCKYDDLGNRDFTVTDFEVVGFAGANDSDFDVKLLYHRTSNWTYSAAAFTPISASNTIVDLTTDHSTDDQLATSEHFAYKRTGLSQAVSGSGSEGYLVLITSTANNAVEYLTVSVGAEF